VGVNPAAPGLYLAAVALQLGAVVAANWWPARRAARVDPIRALAAE
jgi:ABC-type antimicrobial peptide transport system permease subunit